MKAGQGGADLISLTGSKTPLGFGYYLWCRREKGELDRKGRKKERERERQTERERQRDRETKIRETIGEKESPK